MSLCITCLGRLQYRRSMCWRCYKTFLEGRKRAGFFDHDAIHGEMADWFSRQEPWTRAEFERICEEHKITGKPRSQSAPPRGGTRLA